MQLPRFDRKKIIRLKSFGLAGLDYVMNVSVLYIYAYHHIIDAYVPNIILVIAIVFNLIFSYMIVSDHSLRFKDPSLTSLQVAAAVVINYVAFYLAPQIAYVFLVNLFIPLAYASLSFNRKQFLLFTLVISGSLVVAVFAFNIQFEMTTQSKTEKIIACFVYSLALFRYMAINAQISSLRNHLYEKNKSLKNASDKLSYMANHDVLTGLPNRRYFLSNLEQTYAEAIAKGNSFCISIIDIDYFKKINDTHGHAVGDEALAVLGNIFLKTTNEEDFVARYGGEEFVILLVDTDLHTASKILERIRLRVEHYHWEDILPWGGVTCSVGIAEFNPKLSLKDIIARADNALYRAKKQGRNQVCIAR